MQNIKTRNVQSLTKQVTESYESLMELYAMANSTESLDDATILEVYSAADILIDQAKRLIANAEYIKEEAKEWKRVKRQATCTTL